MTLSVYKLIQVNVVISHQLILVMVSVKDETNKSTIDSGEWFRLQVGICNVENGE